MALSHPHSRLEARAAGRKERVSMVNHRHSADEAALAAEEAGWMAISHPHSQA